MRYPLICRTLGRIVVVILGMAATFAGPYWAVAGDPAPFPMDVVVLTCDADPGSVPQATIPAGCTGTDGALVTITDAGDNEIGSCTTTGSSCVANTDLSGGNTVTATLGSAAIPDGYEAIENPITLEIVNEFSGPTFVLIPGETTDLPNTGAGATPRHGTPGLPAMLLFASLALVAAGVRSRQSATP